MFFFNFINLNVKKLIHIKRLYKQTTQRTVIKKLLDLIKK